jgi:hypothetical protein
LMAFSFDFINDLIILKITFENPVLWFLSLVRLWTNQNQIPFPSLLDYASRAFGAVSFAIWFRPSSFHTPDWISVPSNSGALEIVKQKRILVGGLEMLQKLRTQIGKADTDFAAVVTTDGHCR